MSGKRRRYHEDEEGSPGLKRQPGTAKAVKKTKEGITIYNLKDGDFEKLRIELRNYFNANLQYGRIGEIFEADEYGEYSYYEHPLPPPLPNNATQDQRDLRKAQLSSREKLVGVDTRAKPSAFTVMLSAVDAECSGRLENDETWAGVRREKDPLELFELFRGKLRGGQSKNPAKQKTDAKQAYYAIKQHPDETPAEMRVRFTNQIKAMQDVGADVPPADEQALQFYDALDERYSIFVSDEMKNNEDPAKAPADIYEASDRASRAKEKLVRQRYIAPAALVVTKKVAKKKMFKGKAKKQECSEDDEQNSDCSEDEDDAKSEKDAEKTSCYFCGKPGHIQINCTRYKKAQAECRAEGKEKKRTLLGRTEKAKTKENTCAMMYRSHYDDDDDDYDDLF